MDLLILGGTVFLGRHLVDAALARGHRVTLFNRGQHNPELYPEVEKLRGDRDGGLAELAGRRWDAVIDPSGYVPRLVRASAELLAPSIERYLFISSLSVYADTSRQGLDERAPPGRLADETVEVVDGITYGPLKALCERAAEAACPGRFVSIRAGLIVGPHDPTNRFTYWPRRVSQGGEFVAPGRPQRAVQFIDARDLPNWAVHLAESGSAGIFNATGPARPLTMARLQETCMAASAVPASPVWLPDAFLLAQGLVPWMELPLWIPESDARMAGFMAVDCRRAIDAELSFRPLFETVRDTLAWATSGAVDARAGIETAGLQPDREAELIAAWRATSQ